LSYAEAIRGLILWIFWAAVVVLLVAPAATAAVTTEAVLNTPAYEVEPSVGNGYFAWAQASPTRPNRFNVVAKPDGGPRFKVNPAGTVAFANDIDETTLVFSQRSRPSRPSNLRFFDLASKTASNPPSGVNTRRNEAGGTLAGNDLLFARYSRAGGKIYLFDLVTEQRTLLDSISTSGYVQTGDVDGGLAAWIKCRRPAHCNTFVYDLATKTKTRVPNPQRRSQYAVSLADDGTVYFGESTNINCGNSLAIWRYDVGGFREKLFGFRRARDIAVTTPVENLDGSTTIYYDRYNCNTGAADIFKTTVGP
jgi:hypothetical protein